MGSCPSFLFPGLSLLFPTAGSAPFIISLEILPSYSWRPVVSPLLVRGVALLLSQRFSWDFPNPAPFRTQGKSKISRLLSPGQVPGRILRWEESNRRGGSGTCSQYRGLKSLVPSSQVGLGKGRSGYPTTPTPNRTPALQSCPGFVIWPKGQS